MAVGRTANGGCRIGRFNKNGQTPAYRCAPWAWAFWKFGASARRVSYTYK